MKTQREESHCEGLTRPLEGKATSLDRKNALMVVRLFDCNRLWFLLSRSRVRVSFHAEAYVSGQFDTWHP